MKIVTVIPLQKSPFKAELTYFTPKDIKNGSIVSVSIRNKKILGLVVSSLDAKTAKSNIKEMPFMLKKITDIKEHSIFRNEFIESIIALSSYFISNTGNGLISFIPVIFREKYDEISKFLNKEKSLNLISTPFVHNIKNEKLLLQADLEDRISFYKTLIRGQFALKKSVFIILPTEYDIHQFYQSLSKGIENFTYYFHSGLKPKVIIEQYKQISNSSHGVLILGTAPFLSIFCMNIGTIIVEHENSNAYKMIPKPHFDSRIFAEIYASKIKAKFILSDKLLRYETIARKEADDFNEVFPMSFRINFKGKIEIFNSSLNLDNIKKNKTSKFEIINKEIFNRIDNTLKYKKNVFIFSLRKGLATYTICRDCKEIVNCVKCLSPIVLYLSRDKKKRMFMCNKCNSEKNSETVCANCGSWNLMPLGIGTDTVYEEIKNKFPKTKIFKLDKESVKTVKEAEKIIEEFKKNSGSILIGTEMVFFYLKEKVDLSIIASFDSLWTIPNFKMGEKIVQILLSILSKTEKSLIINTKNIEDNTLLAIKSENLLSIVREELADRKNLHYPPFKRFIKITYLGDKKGSIEAKIKLSEIFKEYNPELFSGFISKKGNQYKTNALIRMDPQNWFLPELSSISHIDKNLFNLLSSLPPSYEVIVDPDDLL